MVLYLPLISLLLLSPAGATSESYRQPISFASNGGGAATDGTNRLRAMVLGLGLPLRPLSSDAHITDLDGGRPLLGAVNDAPRMIQPLTLQLPEIVEDLPSNPGTAVSDILAGGGEPVFADIDRGSLRGIALIDVVASNGLWQYSIDGGGAWLSLTDISDQNALLLPEDGETTRIRFVPDADYSGADTGKITFRAWDQSDGAQAGTRGNGAVNGGTSAFSTQQGTIGVAVLAANDVPAVAETAFADFTGSQGVDLNLNAAGNFVDPDGDPLVFSAMGLPSGFSIDSGTGIIGGDPSNEDALASPYHVTVTATDPSFETQVHSFTLFITDTNDAPTADAGSDWYVEEGDTVVLDATGSTDPDDAIVSYSWTQTSGPQVVLSDDTDEEPTFTAPDVGPQGTDLSFTLTVTDSRGGRSTDETVVSVAALDEQPFVMVDADAPPPHAMPGRAYVLPLSAASQESGCSDLTYAFVGASGVPESMSINQNEDNPCLAEVRWIPDADDADRSFAGIQVVVTDGSSDSPPVSFGVSVLAPLAIEPKAAVLLRTNGEDLMEEFAISGGRPHSLSPRYEYELIDADTDKLITSGAIPGNESGDFRFNFSTTGRPTGCYRLRVVDGEGFSKVSGLIEIKDVTTEPIAMDSTDPIDPDAPEATVREVTGDVYNGATITVPAGSSGGKSVTLAISQVTEGQLPISETATSGEVIEFSARSDDTEVTFSQDIEVTLPYSGIDGINRPMNIRVYTFDPDLGRWTLVRNYEINTTAETITFWVSHFSLFTVAESERSSTTVTGGSQREDFRMVSFPVHPDDPDPLANFLETFDGYDDTQWRFAAYDYRTGMNDEGNTTDFAEKHPMAPGMAYWIISRESATLTVKGLSLSQALPYETQLHPGWNMISCPFSKTVFLADLSVSRDGTSFESVSESDMVDGAIYRFDPRTDQDGNRVWYTKMSGPSASLVPFQGYWIFSHESAGIILRYAAPMTSASSQAGRPSAYDKAVRLAMRSFHRILDAIASHALADGKNRSHRPPPPPSVSASGSARDVIGQDGGGGAGGCFAATLSRRPSPDLVTMLAVLLVAGIVVARRAGGRSYGR